MATYQDVLQLTGDAERGRQRFTKKCSMCHRVGDIGHQVAPDLTSVVNKSKSDLLIAILDPSREAQTNYNTYSLETEDGRVFSGIIVSESADRIILRWAEGKEQTIFRNNVAQLVATGASLMPEGLEKDLSKQDLADVLEFIKTIGKRPKSKPSNK